MLLLLLLGLRRIEKLKILDIFKKNLKGHYVLVLYCFDQHIILLEISELDLERRHLEIQKDLQKTEQETGLGRVNSRAKAQARSKIQTPARFKVVCQDMSE